MQYNGVPRSPIYQTSLPPQPPNSLNPYPVPYQYTLFNPKTDQSRPASAIPHYDPDPQKFKQFQPQTNHIISNRQLSFNQTTPNMFSTFNTHNNSTFTNDLSGCRISAQVDKQQPRPINNYCKSQSFLQIKAPSLQTSNAYQSITPTSPNQLTGNFVSPFQTMPLTKKMSLGETMRNKIFKTDSGQSGWRTQNTKNYQNYLKDSGIHNPAARSTVNENKKQYMTQSHKKKTEEDLKTVPSSEFTLNYTADKMQLSRQNTPSRLQFGCDIKGMQKQRLNRENRKQQFQTQKGNLYRQFILQKGHSAQLDGEKKLTVHEREIQEKNKELELKIKEIFTKNRTLIQKNNKIQQLSKEVAALKEANNLQIFRFEQQKKQLHAQILTLQLTISQKSREATARQAQIASLQARIQHGSISVNDTVIQLNERINQLNSKVSELTHSLLTANQLQIRAQEQRNNSQTYIKSLEQTQITLSVELQSVKIKLNQVKEAENIQKQKHVQSLNAKSKLQQQYKQLNKQIADVKNQVQRQNQLNRKLKSQIETLTQQNDILKTQNQEFTDKYVTIKKKYDFLQANYDSKKNQTKNKDQEQDVQQEREKYSQLLKKYQKKIQDYDQISETYILILNILFLDQNATRQIVIKTLQQRLNSVQEVIKQQKKASRKQIQTLQRRQYELNRQIKRLSNSLANASADAHQSIQLLAESNRQIVLINMLNLNAKYQQLEEVFLEEVLQ